MKSYSRHWLKYKIIFQKFLKDKRPLGIGTSWTVVRELPVGRGSYRWSLQWSERTMFTMGSWVWTVFPWMLPLFWEVVKFGDMAPPCHLWSQGLRVIAQPGSHPSSLLPGYQGSNHPCLTSHSYHHAIATLGTPSSESPKPHTGINPASFRAFLTVSCHSWWLVPSTKPELGWGKGGNVFPSSENSEKLAEKSLCVKDVWIFN